MMKSRAVACMSLLLIVGMWRTWGLCAWGQEQPARTGAEQQITAKDAEQLEEGLKTSPDNLAAREQLIQYYFRTMLTSRVSAIEEKREQHIFWLIENHPESELAGSPEASIAPIGFSGSTEGYQHGKQLWLEAVEKHPDDVKIVRHAAQFLFLFDRDTGRGLLKKALLLDPSDAQTSSMLAQSYMQERMMTGSPEEKTALAQKALSVSEQGLEKGDGEERFYVLGDVATEAFEAGDMVKAEQYANELLQSAADFKKDWNYGNAVYNGNVVLGRIALRRGDIAGAKQHLLAAGDTPGSPQLDSFGPNMALAKELLEKGERDTVLSFLQSCAKFWKMGGDKLPSWISTVKSGGTPDFGVNLDI